MSDTTDNRITRLFTLDNVLCFLLTVYITLNIYFSSPMPLILSLIFGIGGFVFIKLLYKKADTLNISEYGHFEKRELLLFLTLILIVDIVAIAWNYPASMEPDAMSQYRQALKNKYTDWHPLFHTLIFFKLPTAIWQDYTSCAIFQCGFIALVLLYFCFFCRKYFLSKKLTTILLLFILANPIYLKMATKPLKDIPFSYCMMLATIFLIEIYITNGTWLKQKRNKILFGLVCFGIVFFRHNGIANFLLMIAALIIFYKDNQKFIIWFSTIFLVVRFIITVPVYNILDIGKNGGVSEMLGVPLNQISYIYNNGGIVFQDELAIMNRISNLENWKKFYRKNNFNNIKFKKGTPNNYDKEYVKQNYKEILKIWIHMAYRNPILACKSYFYVISPIWGISKRINFTESKHNKIEYCGPQWVRTTMDNYVLILEKTHLKHFLLDIGEGLMLILLSLSLTIRRMRLDYKALIPYILVLSNIVIIMCLITGSEKRFVYSSILCAYPLILYALCNKITRTASNSEAPLSA